MMTNDTEEIPLTLPDLNGSEPSTKKGSNAKLWVAAFIVVILVVALILGVIFLARAEGDTTARVRDIFIIFMALESLVLGVAMVILIIQVATLINLLQNEIKPILDSTNETVSNLRGTTQFLSNNMVEPVMKMNEYLAGLKKFFDLVRPGRR